ncbi:glycosyl hydrolases family 18-domain-containing protein [Polychytrium aggregatum]|uniref:glycosyl hydrolases family 18-domain-containing protein n=1 Tax=Polychytrium aggregatum TaxID=110093 RepID=UPI0022FE48A1|nr:glycosyl hydrolases family 18-domain-containing protein [Polychytrium aggregatum]KAI9209053.1 glycosyl hydrolases family 18-domain-containing protein [Polychytrium aggregatum]
MLVSSSSTVLAATALAAGAVVAASPLAARGNFSPQRIIGYYESWYYYDNNNLPWQFTAKATASYTHINYAFATVAYHTPTDQYYVDFTDTWADYEDCVDSTCPSQCIAIPPSKQCNKSGNIAMVPYIGYNTSCPATSCWNPSEAPGSPRSPPCEAVLTATNTQYDSTSKNAYICGNYAYVLNKVKPTMPNTKFLISVGGWYDSNLFSAATEDKYIDAFVTSVVKYVQFFGFDGVDFDWEYPGWEHGGEAVTSTAPAAAGNGDTTYDCSKTTCVYPNRNNDKTKFNNLLTKVRAAFTAAGKTPSGSDYLITIAAPAGTDKMDKLDMATICSAVDTVNIMTYDIHGEWETLTNHQAAMFDDTPPTNPPNPIAPTSVEIAVNTWLTGCPASKVVVGVPFYGHKWVQVPAGSNFGLFQNGTAPTDAAGGSINYNVIMADTTLTTHWDPVAQASWAYSSTESTFYSYDTPEALNNKAAYVANNNLGGFMPCTQRHPFVDHRCPHHYHYHYHYHYSFQDHYYHHSHHHHHYYYHHYYFSRQDHHHHHQDFQVFHYQVAFQVLHHHHHHSCQDHHYYYFGLALSHRLSPQPR